MNNVIFEKTLINAIKARVYFNEGLAQMLKVVFGNVEYC